MRCCRTFGSSGGIPVIGTLSTQNESNGNNECDQGKFFHHGKLLSSLLAITIQSLCKKASYNNQQSEKYRKNLQLFL
jgi:hypothetical protein